MKEKLPLIVGAHMSIAGGLYKAVERAVSIKSTTMQIFTKNNRSFFAPSIDQENAALFKEHVQNSKLTHCTVHAAYIINIAAQDTETERNSVKSLAQEVARCAQLEIPYLVLHPGSAGTQDKKSCIKKIAHNICRVLEENNGSVTILLETMAGQGSVMASTFEELADILDLIKYKEQVGVCFDTSHVHCAGYDISTPEAYHETIHSFDKTIGLDFLKAFHLNDSQKPKGSRLDRHAPLGQGTIPLTTFAEIVNDGRFYHIPKILETPSDPEMALYRNEIALLKSYLH